MKSNGLFLLLRDPEALWTIMRKCPLGLMLLLSSLRFLCMLKICPCCLEKKNMCSFLSFIVAEIMHLHSWIRLRHNKKPPGVKLASFFLYGPTALRHYPFSIPSHAGWLLCHLEWDTVNKLYNHMNFLVALLKSINRSCVFINLN